MIHENSPVTNSFVSVPADMVRNMLLCATTCCPITVTSMRCCQGQLNCAAYLAGILAGILDSAKFVSMRLFSAVGYFIC